MIEAGANEIPEDKMIEAIYKATISTRQSSHLSIRS